MQNDIHKHVLILSDEFKVRADIVLSIIEVESSNNKDAIRFEPKLYERLLKMKKINGHVPNPPTYTTELISRATSWGLMQILGESARTLLNYKSRYLSSLLDIEINIANGCKLLYKYLEMSDFNYDEALLLYNGGADKTYPCKINEIANKKGLQYE